MELQIAELEPDDLALVAEALDLLNRTQGQGLFSSDYLTSKALADDALVVVGYMEQRLISLGCAEIIEDFDYYLPFDPKIEKRFMDAKVGSLCASSVHEDFQGRGIGQQITTQRMSWLVAEGCDVVVGVSWVSGLPHTSNRVFEKLGFSPVAEVEGFYTKGAIEHPFDCPGCRVQPCECAAILYERWFDDQLR